MLKCAYIKTILVLLMLSALVAATPALAAKKVIGCVPSPNPNVPPCNLDQSPLTPSVIEAAQQKAESEKSDGALSLKSKKSGARARGGRGGAHVRGGRKGASIGCVPSPNPNVPPCNLDQSPLTPSVIEQQAAQKTDSDAATPNTSKKTSK